MTVGRERGRLLRSAAAGAVVVAVALSVALVPSRGGGNDPQRDGGKAGTAARADASSAPPPVTVTDRSGSTYAVQAMAVVETPAVTADAFLWSAAPGQDFLADQLTVTNPTTRAEPLADFDDLTSGLADDLDLVMPASDAASSRFASSCGAEPGFPPSLCPISYGQGMVVDADSTDHDDHVAALTLAPGSSAQISVSYGPVPAQIATAVSLWFVGGPSPVELTP